MFMCSSRNSSSIFIIRQDMRTVNYTMSEQDHYHLQQDLNYIYIIKHMHDSIMPA